MKIKIAAVVTVLSVLTTGCSKAADEKPDTTKTKVNQTYLSAGTVICSNITSFFKVRAVEIARNPYVNLPTDCDTVGADIEINLLRVISSPGLGNMALIGNSGGTAYVRMVDVKK